MNEKDETSSPLHPSPPAEERILEEGIKKIVIGRELTPRSPQWSRAWWRTLERYNARLADLRRRGRHKPTPADPNNEKGHPTS